MNLLPLIFACAPILAVAAQTAASAYVPAVAPCPDGFSLVRNMASNQTLSTAEAAYISSRKSDVLPGAWKSYLANVQNATSSVVLPDYVSNILGGKNASDTPTLGIAGSGGGYRAAIFGAGVINAIDGRNTSSVSAGTGGLLQAASYYSALSGGSWLLTSLVQADFPTIHDVVFGSSNPGEYTGWNTQFDIIQPGDNQTANTLFIGTLLGEIAAKKHAGFPVTIADIWARALSRHFVNGTSPTDFFSNSSLHGAGILFSDLAKLPSFLSHSLPFPIVTTNVKSQNGNQSNLISGGIVPLSNPIFEINVYEMGTFDPMLSAFIPTKYLGTQNTTSCVTGFDQAAFITGTSSELFEQFNTSAAALLSSPVGPLIEALNASIPQPGVELDVAMYPNPFFGLANDTFISSHEEYLTLIDGGEDGQDLPMAPLLVKARNIDTILAIDVEGDTVDHFANGSSLIASAKRTALFPSTYSFPPVPAAASDFVSQNLTTRPTFFGCDSDPSAPLIIYIANGGPPRNGQPALTNTTTFQSTYDRNVVQQMLDQTFIVTVQGLAANQSAIKDPEWPACLACAVVDRARQRNGTERSGVCKSCFARYCWAGVSSGSGTSTSSAGSTIVRERLWQQMGAVFASVLLSAALILML